MKKAKKTTLENRFEPRSVVREARKITTTLSLVILACLYTVLSQAAQKVMHYYYRKTKIIHNVT